MNDWTTLLEVLIASGLFALLGEGARQLWGRKRSRIDAAEVIERTSLKLLEPLERQLDQAHQQVTGLQAKIANLETHVEEMTAWSQRAVEVLEQHNLIGSVPPRPSNIRPIR